MELLAAWPWAVDFAHGAPSPDDADWNSPEDASYDQEQEQQ